MQADAAGQSTVQPPAQASPSRVYPTFWQGVAIALFPLVLQFCAIAAPAFPGPQWLASLDPVPIIVTVLAGTAFLLWVLPAYPVLGLAGAITALFIPRRPRLRATLGRLSAALLAGTLGMIALIVPLDILRMSGMQSAARRAQPLIAALETYRADRGKYPASLSDLVPDYLHRVPATGMLGYPQFSYDREARVPGRSRTRSGASPAYDLYVDCPLLLLGFDTFHYWPSQDYPDQMWGGGVERIDGWAYVHE
jgi:hypothetical protein